MLFFYENRGQELATWFSDTLFEGAHLHRHVELIYMMEGSATAYVGDRAVNLSEGDLFVSLPYQVHDYRTRDTKRVAVVLFPPELCPEFHNALFHSVLSETVLKNAVVHPRLMRLLYALVESNEPTREHYLTEVRGLALALLSELFRLLPAQPQNTPNTNILQNILTYCSQNYAGDLRLDTLSQALHVNKYYISHLFTQKLHMNFNEYVGMLRVSAALPRLESGNESITDVAYSVGFNSHRSFNRLFLKHMNCSPRAYRQAALQNAAPQNVVLTQETRTPSFILESMALLAHHAALR